MAEQQNRALRVVFLYPVIDEPAVVDEFEPAAAVGKVPGEFSILAVAAMVVRHDGDAVRIGPLRKSLVAAAMFSESVKELHDCAHFAVRGPGCAMNFVPVGRRNFEHAGYTARHD